MSEWLKEHAWKACVGETLPWVRIPLSPPIHRPRFKWQAAVVLCGTPVHKPRAIEQSHARIVKDPSLGLDALPKAEVSAPIKFTLDLGRLGEHTEGD